MQILIIFLGVLLALAFAGFRVLAEYERGVIFRLGKLLPQAKGPGIELNVSRIESITGVTGASTPASIYNTVQMIGSTGPGIHLR